MICARCGIDKPDEEFLWRSFRARSKRRPYCRECGKTDKVKPPRPPKTKCQAAKCRARAIVQGRFCRRHAPVFGLENE